MYVDFLKRAIVASNASIVALTANATSTIYVDVQEEQPGISMQTCSDLDSLSVGRWDNRTKTWMPSHCTFAAFNKSTVRECFVNKTFGFYGDSTLRNIVNEIISLAGANIKLETWASAPGYRCGGGAIARGGNLNMYWTPSAYYQKPASIGSMSTDDVSVIGIAAWDMGEYYKGVNTWFIRMKSLLLEAAKKRNGRPLYVMHVHHLYPNQCKLQHDTESGRKNVEKCRRCNAEDAMLAFREALESAVLCVKTSGFDNIHLVDTFGITSNSFAERVSDGVHFDGVVTRGEVNLLLAAAGHGMRHVDRGNNFTCPLNPAFEASRELNCPLR